MKIAIIGSANIEIEKAIIQEHLKKEDIEIVRIEDAKLSDYRETVKEYVYNNPYPAEMFTREKKFICKGKHKYEKVVETNGNFTTHRWICQCGKELQ